jgi:transcriptional regulator with XRE-family HTH domain
MYLNGKRVREAARLREMTREHLQKKSGIDAENFAYYWDNDATAPSQAHVDALAKALNVKAATLLWSGLPRNITLRPDKFVTPSASDIEWDISKAKHVTYFKPKPKKGTP